MVRFKKHTAYTWALALALIILGTFTLGLLTFISLSGTVPEGMEVLHSLTMVLAVVGIVASLMIWRRYDWAFRIAGAFFLVQLVEIRTPGFHYNLFSSFRLFFILEIGDLFLAFNYFALGMLILTFLAWRFTEVE